MEILKSLAREIGGDGGEPTGGDVASVMETFGFTPSTTTEALIRTHLAEAGRYLSQAEAMQDDPLWAVNKYTDDRPSVAAAEHWKQEFIAAAEQELTAIVLAER